MLPEQTLATFRAVGQKLKKQRESKKLSIKKTARTLRIPESTLKTLESPDGTNLNKVYLEGLYIRYAKLFDLEEQVIKQLRTVQANDKVKKASRKKPKKVFILSSSVKRLSFVAVFVVLLSYILIQLFAFFFSPSLALNVQDRVVTNNPEFVLEGRVARSSIVLLNNSPVLLERDGSFEQTIYLQEGINVIYITATNNLSRTTEKKIEIILKQD